MDLEDRKFVKVRVNASGRRIIGIAAFDALYRRFSDFLNAIDPFLLLKQEHGELAVRKDAVSYLEALEEGEGAASGLSPAGSFRRVEVELRDLPGALQGEIFFPEGASLLDLLGDERRFLALRDVSFATTVERYRWLAVPKAAVVVLRLADR